MGREKITEIKKKMRMNFKISLGKIKQMTRERVVHDFKNCHQIN